MTARSYFTELMTIVTSALGHNQQNRTSKNKMFICYWLFKQRWLNIIGIREVYFTDALVRATNDELHESEKSREHIVMLYPVVIHVDRAIASTQTTI